MGPNKLFTAGMPHRTPPPDGSLFPHQENPQSPSINPLVPSKFKKFRALRALLDNYQKTELQAILGQRYKICKNAKKLVNLETLNISCLIFAKRTSKHPKLNKRFPLNENMHSTEKRKYEKFIKRTPKD